MNKTSVDRILILGGGPAGAGVALGLVRLGYRVTLINKPRSFHAVEGISKRTLAGLRNAGFQQALEAIAEPCLRHVLWGGESSQSNSEHLVHRPSLDQGIEQDLIQQGVEVIRARVRHVAVSEQGCTVSIAQGQQEQRLSTDFLVEARGRSAPFTQLERVRGIETVALLQVWQGPPLALGSAVQSFADGWAWLASGPDGRRYLQLTLAAGSAQLPDRSALSSFCRQGLQNLALAQPFLKHAQPVGAVTARASTPILCRTALADHWLRVGDAAMAVDPLSGNGIFQALSSALLAPTVINTLLSAPERADLARRFYQDRLNHLFQRFARTGRDFYRMEQRWSERAFWSQRRSWPDEQPLHQPPDPHAIRVEKRPVVCHGLIEEQAVVLTADQPLGIWHLDGIALAPLVQALQQGALIPNHTLKAQIQQRFKLDLERVEQAYQWLRTQRLL